MSGSTRYSPELRERAVKMAIEKRSDYPSEWATFSAIAKLLGMPPETLRTWVRKAQVDSGSRQGIKRASTIATTSGVRFVVVVRVVLMVPTLSVRPHRRRYGVPTSAQLRSLYKKCSHQRYQPVTLESHASRIT